MSAIRSSRLAAAAAAPAVTIDRWASEVALKGSGLFHFWVAVVHRGVGFHIVWFDQKSSETADRPAFDKVLQSIVFNG